MKAIMAYYSYYHPLCTLMRTLSQLVLWVTQWQRWWHTSLLLLQCLGKHSRVFYYCGNDIEHEVKLGPPRMGIVEYVDFVISSLLKIKVTLFICTSISTTSWVSISYYSMLSNKRGVTNKRGAWIIVQDPNNRGGTHLSWG